MSYEPTEWKNGDVITETELNDIEQGVRSMNSAYTPTTWANGDIITAEKLNNIETGLANGPTGKVNITSTAEVDVTQYAAAQVVDANLVAGNIKKDTIILGVTGSYEGSGGGDFSTATVTVINNSGTEFQLQIAQAFDNSAAPEYTGTTSYIPIDAGDSATITAILYKNKCFAMYTDTPGQTFAVSGDATVDEGFITITGDCTITVTDA